MGQRVALVALATAATVGVVGCGGARKPSPTQPITSFGSHCDNCGTRSRASLHSFTRHYWWGHGRLFVLHRSGRGAEKLRTYAERPPGYATLTFEVTSVTGTPVAADARIRVTSARNAYHVLSQEPIRVGTVGDLRLRHGVITDSITHATFCAPHVDRCGL